MIALTCQLGWIAFVVLDVAGQSEVLSQLPDKATQAWRNDRVSILDVDPLRVSDESFSATIKFNETWHAREVGGDDIKRSGGAESEFFIAKLDRSLLISSKNEKREDRLLFRGGQFWKLRRASPDSDWILVRKGAYEDVDPETEPFDNELFSAARLHNERLLSLWGIANLSFSTILAKWEVTNIDAADDQLLVTAKPSEVKTATLIFSPAQEYRLMEYRESVAAATVKSDRITKFSDVSKNYDQFTVTRTTDGTSDGEEITSVETYSVRINMTLPDEELFQLESYDITLRDDPIEAGSDNWVYAIPFVVGILLIAAAILIKRRSV